MNFAYDAAARPQEAQAEALQAIAEQVERLADDDEKDPVLPDGGRVVRETADAPGVGPADLTLFQLEMLYVLADEGPQKGLAVKVGLQERYGEEVNHGRLYPNLDALVDMGLVEKSQRDRRTNEYVLSGAGRQFVRADADRREQTAVRMQSRANGGAE